MYGGIMYQEMYSEMMKTFEENGIFIPQHVEYSQPEVKYFIYNDNQSNRSDLEKLCLT